MIPEKPFNKLVKLITIAFWLHIAGLAFVILLFVLGGLLR